MQFNITFKTIFGYIFKKVVLCIQIHFVSTEKNTRIASRASCYKYHKRFLFHGSDTCCPSVNLCDSPTSRKQLAMLCLIFKMCIALLSLYVAMNFFFIIYFIYMDSELKMMFAVILLVN